MTRKAQRPTAKPARGDKTAGKAAVLGALSLLSASMGLLLNDGAQAKDVTVNKAKTADKAFNAMNDYIRARQVNPNPPGKPSTPRAPAGKRK